MNKKLTKVLSVFLIAGVIGAGAVGAAGCHKHTYDKDTWVVSPDDDTKHGNPSNCKHEGLIDAKSLEDHVDADNNGKCDKCGEDIPGYTPPAGATVTAVTVSAAGNATSVAVGGDLQLSATVTGTGNPAQTVTWTTESDKIELSDSGLVTGKTATADGEKVTIKATSTADPTKYGEIQLTVTAAGTVTITSVTVSATGNATSVMEKDWVQLTATVAGEGDYSSEVTWTSSDDTKATVDKNGKVTGVAACDEVTITATSKADDTKYGSVTLSVTAYVDEHAGTKYAEIRDKSNNIIAEDFKHTTKADITAYGGSLGGTPGTLYYSDEVGARFDVTGGALVIGDGKKDSSGKNVSAIVDFGLVDGVVEGYFTYKFDTEASSGGNKIHFLDAGGNKVLEMIAYGNNSSKHFQFKLNGVTDPTKESGSGAITAAKDTLYKVYFKIDLDDNGKLTLKIDETTVYDNVPTGIDSVAGLQFETSDSGNRKSTIDNIAVAADQMTAAEAAAKLKTKLLADLEDEYETYDRTNDYTKNGALIHAAYQTAVAAINAEGATIAEMNAAYKTAVDAMADVLKDEEAYLVEGSEGPGSLDGSELILNALSSIGESFSNFNIYEPIEIDGTTIPGNAMQAIELMDIDGLIEKFNYTAATEDFTGKIRTKSELKAWADNVKAAVESANIPTDAEIIDDVKDAVNKHIDKLIDAAKAENAEAASVLEGLRTSLKGDVTQVADAYDENEHNGNSIVLALQTIDEEIAGRIQQALQDAIKSLSELQTEYKGKLETYASQILETEAENRELQSAPQGLVTAVNEVLDEWKQTIDAVTDADKGTIPGLYESGKDALDAAFEEYTNRYFEITVKISSSCNIAVADSAPVYATISKGYGDQLFVHDIRINGFLVTEATAGSVTLTQGGIDADPTHVKIYGNLEIIVTKMEDVPYVKEEKWKVTGEEDSYTQNDKLVISYGNSLFSFTSMLGATFKDLSVTIDGETFTHSVASTSITKDTNNAETPYYIYASAALKTLTIYNTLTESGGEKDNRCGTIYYSINDGAPVVVKTLSSNGNMKNACVIQNVPAGANIKLWAENTSSSGGATLHIYGIYATIDEDLIPETVHVTWEGDQQDYWYRHGDSITAPALPADTADKQYTHWEFTCHEEEGHYHGQMWSDGMQLNAGEHNLRAAYNEVESIASITISADDGVNNIELGEPLQLNAVVMGTQSGELHDRTVTWSITEGGNIAEITDDGLLSLKVGAAAGNTIKVKANIGEVYSNELEITVTAPTVAEIEITGDNTIKVGDGNSITLEITFKGESGEPIVGETSKITWSITEGDTKASIVGGVLTLNDTADVDDTITVKAVYDGQDEISDEITITVISAAIKWTFDSNTNGVGTKTVKYYESEDDEEEDNPLITMVGGSNNFTLKEVTATAGSTSVSNALVPKNITITASTDVKITIYFRNANSGGTSTENGNVVAEGALTGNGTFTCSKSPETGILEKEFTLDNESSLTLTPGNYLAIYLIVIEKI